MSDMLLDTSAYSELMRGHPVVRQTLREVRSVGMSVIVLAELRAGFRRGTRPAQNEGRLRRFLSESRVRVVPVEEETSERYAILRDDLVRRGRQLSLNDIWIAATAFQHGLRILTADSDFKAIPQVVVDFVEPLE